MSLPRLEEGVTHTVADHSPCLHSIANFKEAFVERLEVELEVDFTKEIFRGRCVLRCRALPEVSPSHVFFDILHLAISDVTDANGGALEWQVRRPEGPKATFGDALAVQWPEGSSELAVRVVYETTSRSTAIQWMAPENTHGKQHPLVFTQSQAICGRSLMPCQDTPAVKMPFMASVTAPQPLVAVCSGESTGEPTVDAANNTRTFCYKQDVPVQSYLVALVVGELESRPIGPRSKVYSEPAICDAAVAEYKDIVEEYIVTAQSVVGGSDYVWGSFNVAIMPSSFIYGGMENPNCTFMNASLIAGDQSLTPTLAHEIVHSWTGNLVTNAKWQDFWLNEGFTRYVERRVCGQMFGEPFRCLLLMVGYNDLIKNIDMLVAQGTPELTCLNPELEGIDPDHAFSRVPYEKGSLFLYYLEDVVGGPERMTEWLRSYVDEFKHRSIGTEHFKEHFTRFFAECEAVQQVDWQHWLKGEGLPDFDLASRVDQSLLEQSRALANAWLGAADGGPGRGHEDMASMKAQQIMLFLDHLINASNAGNSLPAEALAAMDGHYELSKTRNVEVAYRWCMLGCKCKWDACVPTVEGFLATHGRGAYVKPLYQAFAAFDAEKAKTTFKRNRAFYMLVMSAQISKLLGVP